MKEITKAEALILVEEDGSLQYMGTIQVGTRTCIIYRTAIGAGVESKRFRVVYIVE